MYVKKNCAVWCAVSAVYWGGGITLLQVLQAFTTVFCWAAVFVLLPLDQPLETDLIIVCGGFITLIKSTILAWLFLFKEGMFRKPLNSEEQGTLDRLEPPSDGAAMNALFGGGTAHALWTMDNGGYHHGVTDASTSMMEEPAHSATADVPPSPSMPPLEYLDGNSSSSSSTAVTGAGNDDEAQPSEGSPARGETPRPFLPVLESTAVASLLSLSANATEAAPEADVNPVAVKRNTRSVRKQSKL